MAIERKLIRNGNGWALSINSIILGFLDVDPEVNMVKYTMVEDKLIITKSDKKVNRNKK